MVSLPFVLQADSGQVYTVDFNTSECKLAVVALLWSRKNIRRFSIDVLLVQMAIRRYHSMNITLIHGMMAFSEDERSELK